MEHGRDLKILWFLYQIWKIEIFNQVFQQAFIFSNVTIETPQNTVKYVQIYQ